MDLTLPHRERASRMIRMTQAGVIGEPLPPDQVSSDPDVQELFFDLIARSVDTEGTNGTPFTAQWKFSDAEPWHVVVQNGSTRAERGIDPSADVTLESSWPDFIDIGKGAISPPRALVQRRLKMHGGVRNILRFGKLFGN
jgi:alkyl sulfatase BDS1-like metallo-beta-lactamase superfamily hydrolase